MTFDVAESQAVDAFGSDLNIEILSSYHEKTALQRQIDATDRQIDQLVHELYGLTEEEIKIVEAP